VRVLVFSSVALIAAGGILLVTALRTRHPSHYDPWLIPRPATPPGLDPLPDDELWVRWEDPEAAAAEIARIEGAARHASVLPSRYSRVIPPEPAPPAAPVPAATAERDPPSAADPDPTVDVEPVATGTPPGAEPTATPSTGSPAQRPEPAVDAWTAFFEQTIRVLGEQRRRSPAP
jgi:hypothetical protein